PLTGARGHVRPRSSNRRPSRSNLAIRSTQTLGRPPTRQIQPRQRGQYSASRSFWFGFAERHAHSRQSSRMEVSMYCLVAVAVAIIMMVCPTTAHADVVTDWNQTTLEVLKAGNVLGNPWPGARAMVHVAMSDAINPVQGRYTRYVFTAPAAPSASAEAAAVSAARQILLQLVPTQRGKIDDAYADSLARIPDGPAKNEGITLGEQAASVIQADRATDATNAPDTYRPITTPGVWVPTQPPLFPQYAQARPWGMKSSDQVRPGPPPSFASALYA